MRPVRPLRGMRSPGFLVHGDVEPAPSGKGPSAQARESKIVIVDRSILPQGLPLPPETCGLLSRTAAQAALPRPCREETGADRRRDSQRRGVGLAMSGGNSGKTKNCVFLENVRSRIILFPTKKEKRKILFAAGRIQETRQSPSTPAAPTPFRGKTKGCGPQKGARHGRRQVAAGRRRDAPNRLILRARAPNAAKSPTASFPKRPHSPAPRPFLPAPSPPRARRARRSCPPPRPWR